MSLLTYFMFDLNISINILLNLIIFIFKDFIVWTSESIGNWEFWFLTPHTYLGLVLLTHFHQHHYLLCPVLSLIIYKINYYYTFLLSLIKYKIFYIFLLMSMFQSIFSQTFYRKTTIKTSLHKSLWFTSAGCSVYMLRDWFS